MAVLVAYDGSQPARKALKRAVDDHADEEIILLRVIEAAEGSTGAGISLAREKLKEMEAKTDEEVRADVDDLVDTTDLDVRTETAVGQPARQIVEVAEAEGVDQIIVGSHGRSGVSRVLLGSVAEKVVRRAPMPVTVVR
ncbi:universal stress protein [Natrialbaceae archaeon A-gly3]